MQKIKSDGGNRFAVVMPEGKSQRKISCFYVDNDFFPVVEILA